MRGRGFWAWRYRDRASSGGVGRVGLASPAGASVSPKVSPSPLFPAVEVTRVGDGEVAESVAAVPFANKRRTAIPCSRVLWSAEPGAGWAVGPGGHRSSGPSAAGLIETGLVRTIPAVAPGPPWSRVCRKEWSRCRVMGHSAYLYSAHPWTSRGWTIDDR